MVWAHNPCQGTLTSLFHSRETNAFRYSSVLAPCGTDSPSVFRQILVGKSRLKAFKASSGLWPGSIRPASFRPSILFQHVRAGIYSTDSWGLVHFLTSLVGRRGLAHLVHLVTLCHLLTQPCRCRDRLSCDLPSHQSLFGRLLSRLCCYLGILRGLLGTISSGAGRQKNPLIRPIQP